MYGIRIAAIVLIVAGVLGLVYGGFSVTRETHQAKVGPATTTLSTTRSAWAA